MLDAVRELYVNAGETGSENSPQSRPLWEEIPGVQILLRDAQKLLHAVLFQDLLGRQIVGENQPFDLPAPALEIPAGPDLRIAVRLQRDLLKITRHWTTRKDCTLRSR